MAKRTRKQKHRATARRSGPSAAPTRAAASTAGEAEDRQPAASLSLLTPTPTPTSTATATPTSPSASASVAVDLGATDPGRRRVERLSGVAPVARARPPRNQQGGYIQPLESEDAAIPFDRVPYVPADLKRVAIIAAVMIALIIIADIIVSNVVK